MEYQWEKHYETLKMEVANIRKSGKAVVAKDVDEMNERYNSLDNSLRIIQSSPMEYETSAGEIARRQVIMENLKKYMSLLAVADWNKLNTSGDDKSGASSSGVSASTQLRSTVGNNGSTFAGEEERKGHTKYISAETRNPMTMSDRALIQRQQEVIKQQDNVLLDIEKGVDGLHRQAKTIGSEVREQNQIVDDLDEHVDIATDGLRKEAKHAEGIKHKTNDCYKYICIAIEVLILLILVILFFVSSGNGSN